MPALIQIFIAGKDDALIPTKLSGLTEDSEHIVAASGVWREAHVALCSGNCLWRTSEHLSTVLPKYDSLNLHDAFGFV